MNCRIVSMILVLALVFTMLPVSALAESSPVFEGTLRTSQEGIEMIKDLEGFIAQPWYDVSQYSIGYGCSTQYAKKYGFPTDYLTKEQAHQLVLFVLDSMEPYLDSFLEKYNISVNQYQYDALISLTYNLGRNWISDDSRLGALLIDGNFTVNELASAFGIYCHTGTGETAQVLTHLVSRRIREAKLFLYGAYDFDDVEEKFCRLNYAGNVPPGYSDVALYQQGQPYQVLFDPDPTNADGYYFAGWYMEDGRELTPDMIVEDSMTVYPLWTDEPYDVVFEMEAEPYSSRVWLTLTEKTYVGGVPVGGSTTVGQEKPGDSEQSRVAAADMFSDVYIDQWYYSYVDDLVNEGVINGYEDGTFKPNNTVTTGEALKMILLAVGYGEPEQVTDHWASGYHYLALDCGIIVRGDIVDLDVPITRSMMAKVVANAMGLNRLHDTNPYVDTQDTYAMILHDYGITEGYEDGSFRPQRSLTRAELSTIVWRINYFYE